MKHRKKPFITLTIMLLLSLVIGIAAYAASTAGTSGDPLATKSYVDSAISTLKNYVDGKAPTTTTTSNNGNFDVFTVIAGKTVIANKGSEIILRSGSATIISSTNGGIADTTDGVDLPNGSIMPKNHLLIVPGSDGRGFHVTSDAWVMVSGGYTVR